MERLRLLMVRCPKCKGCKGISGRSGTGHPATLPCPRCDAIGEVSLNSLTEAEKNPPIPIRYERDDA
jgi:phage FluMu protein Com